MAWANGSLDVFHGCDMGSWPSLSLPARGMLHGIDLAKCRRLTDFDAGFYTTTDLHQARQWANQKSRRLKGPGAKAIVVRFQIDRSQIAGLEHLAFVTDGSDFYDLVTYCRTGFRSHGRPAGVYDVVYGPVSLWPQLLVVKDCDQVSFHTVRALGVLPQPQIDDAGSPLF